MSKFYKMLAISALVFYAYIPQTSAKICLSGMCDFLGQDAEFNTKGKENLSDKQRDVADSVETDEQPMECHDCQCYFSLTKDIIKFAQKHSGEYKAKLDTNGDGKVNTTDYIHTFGQSINEGCTEFCNWFDVLEPNILGMVTRGENQLLHDLNGDGKVSIDDFFYVAHKKIETGCAKKTCGFYEHLVERVKKHIMEDDGKYYAGIDFNKDGSINGTDLVMITGLANEAGCSVKTDEQKK